MKTNDKKPAEHLNDCFTDEDIISSYTDEQAVEDGVFFDVTELGKISPSIKWDEGAFQYVTANLCYTKGYLRDGETPSVPNFLDLFRNMSAHMMKTGPDRFYNTKTEFPDGTKGEVYAVQNSTGRYTLMLPDDY